MRGSASGDVRSSYGSLPTRQSGGSSASSAVDRLSAGFSKLQSPSAGGLAGPLSKGGLSVPYQSSLAQR